MIIKPTVGGAGAYVPPPEGLQDAVCVDVIDLGMVAQNDFKTGLPKLVHQMKVVFEVAAKMDDGRSFTIGKWYTVSLHEKANLSKDLKAWFGKTPPVDKPWDAECLKGQPCQLLIDHNKRDDGSIGARATVRKAGATKLKPSGTYKRPDPKDVKPVVAGGALAQPAVARQVEQAAPEVAEENIPF